MQDLSVTTEKIDDDAVTGKKVTNSALGVVAHLDLAAVEVDLDAVSPFEILAADANNERFALVSVVATEAAATAPDLDIGVASDANSVVDDFGGGVWAVGDRITNLIRIPAGDNLRATIAAAGTAGKVDVYVHLITPLLKSSNIGDGEINAQKVSQNVKTDLVTVGLYGTVAAFGFPFNVETLTEQPATHAVVDNGGVTNPLSLSTTDPAYTANYQLFPDTEAENDAVYFGSANRFGVMYFDLDVLATYGADSLAWEYWDGGLWQPLTIVWDQTDTTAQNGLRSFQQDGEIIFSAPGNWQQVGINGQSAYWVRARVATGFNITQIPTMNAVEHKLVSCATASEMPSGGTIGRARISWLTESGATNDTIVVLCNLTNGECSALTTLTNRVC